MNICRGTPQFTGTYVVYCQGQAGAATTLFWVIGHGWLREQSKDQRDIIGWIGPLPMLPENLPQPKPSKAAMEFDL